MIASVTHPPIRSYVLRQGRFSPAQQRAYSELLPRYGVPYAAGPIDFKALFGRSAPVVAEIGFGMGETTARIAEERPEVDFLGIEVHSPGVGSLLRMVGERALTNVRIIQHDAMEVVRDMVPAASLSGLHIFFPDPWPKKRHHKRRLIRPESAALFASRLAPGGYLHFATDWEEYAEQALEVLSGTPGLSNTAKDYAPRPESRPETKFERRGIRLGHAVRDLYFHKD
ncbi:tRNA (guanosine(46)-N7)-methyltransferase TrmB [Usitatibacter palustris]|uniref:tRNA (guanine-N(7)-)-methyltransferase n=1 Tax=Usitatibacter palustris TaxID=2732487 RepID=A0A6M4H1C9_9PROT|nr:tRNA (guanosine(46)-N7)-methyltransferase TrmB [Usitatibacter palustris]QJR13301.1 tRNA (guanine-N(7)-)-methyltransferase [Usitatibacter palustris]